MRVGRLIRLLRSEMVEVRAGAAQTGGRQALAGRALHHLDLEGVHRGRLEVLEQQGGQLRAEVAFLSERLRQVTGQVGQLEHQTPVVEQLQAAAESVSQRVDHLEREGASVDQLRSAGEATARRFDSLERRLHDLERIVATAAWLASIDVAETVKISVILATRDRVDRLERAVEAVRAQLYRHWELIVVDDGSTDGTAQLLTRLSAGDGRIKVVTTGAGGPSTARNAGLARATGRVICYADDDNVMQPLWLKAVAWAFSSRPGLEVLYGATGSVVPDPRGDEGIPWLIFEPFDRETLEERNYIDLGAIAHIRDHPEARHDELLAALTDWDLVLRLTRRSPPLALPVIALAYTVDAPGRISQSGMVEQAAERVRAKLRQSRDLRVLAYNAMYPLVSETYIGAEIRVLADRGAQVAWCTDSWQPSPVSVDEPWFPDLASAVAGFAPDLIVVHWSSFARQELDRLSACGVPFALRVHSFDFDPERIELVRRHPLCVGVWAYPEHARMVPGAHDLVNLVGHTGAFPVPEESRPIVLAACAGLPKKDWPTLIGAFAELADKGADCRIIMGITSGHEGVPQQVREMIKERRANISLSVDVPNDQVRALLARTAVVVYTNGSDQPFGMPSSVIEGMLGGTSVVLPDDPAAARMAGPRCRTYRSVADIVWHVTQVLAGGEAVAEEQAFNRRFAEERYADPAAADAFYDQLFASLARWRQANG